MSHPRRQGSGTPTGFPRLYFVSRARLAAGELAHLVPELVAAGVDLLQLREKEMEALDVMRAAEPVLTACRAAGVPFVVNDRPDIALALGADGVHLGQNDLPLTVARQILGERIIGRSTHATEELDAELSAAPRADYLVAGPVWPTPTKEGRPGTGVELLAHAAARSDLPWFAIGGINPDNLPEVLGAGARRIVVVRAIAEAPDPIEATARLRAALDEAPP